MSRRSPVDIVLCLSAPGHRGPVAPADVAGNGKRFLETKPSSKKYAWLASVPANFRNVQKLLEVYVALI